MFPKRRAPHKDTGAIVKEVASRLDVPTRRVFLRNAIGLGSLTLLSGCDVVDGFSAERMLQNISDSTTGFRLFCSIPISSRPNIRKARSQGPSLSTPSIRRQGAGDRSRRVPARHYRTRGKPKVLDTRRTLRPAAVHSDHPAYLHRGMERHRKWTGVRFSHFWRGSGPT